MTRFVLASSMIDVPTSGHIIMRNPDINVIREYVSGTYGNVNLVPRDVNDAKMFSESYPNGTSVTFSDGVQLALTYDWAFLKEQLLNLSMTVYVSPNRFIALLRAIGAENLLTRSAMNLASVNFLGDIIRIASNQQLSALYTALTTQVWE